MPKIIRDVFFPFQPIKQKNENFFSGRIKFLKRAISNLQFPGGCLIIYGDRQIGKSSFKNQLINILTNNSVLIKREKINVEDFSKTPICIALQSASNFKDVRGLLAQLIISEEEFSLYHFFPDVFAEMSISNIKEKTREWNLNFYGISRKSITKNEFVDERKEIKGKGNDIVFDFFITLINKILELHNDKELIIFIDEFDLLEDKKGMGELMKLLPDVHFVIVGIAETYTQLVLDHLSAQHKLAGNNIKLPYWSNEEIREIFKKAKQFYYHKIEFDESFLERVYEDAGGLPGYAHLLGSHALKIFQENNEKLVIDSVIYDQAIQRIFNLDLYDIKDNLDQENFAELIEIMKGRSKVKKLIEILCKYPASGEHEDLVYSEFPDDFKEDFDNIVTDLCNKEFLKRGYNNQKIRFAMPLTRQAAILAIKYKISFD